MTPIIKFAEVLHDDIATTVTLEVHPDGNHRVFVDTDASGDQLVYEGPDGLIARATYAGYILKHAGATLST